MLRRAFIKLIGIVPGLSLFSKINSEPTIIFPKGMKFTGFHSADYYMGSTYDIKSNLRTLFDRDDAFYRAMKSREPMIISSREMRIPLKLEGDL